VARGLAVAEALLEGLSRAEGGVETVGARVCDPKEDADATGEGVPEVQSLREPVDEESGVALVGALCSALALKPPPPPAVALTLRDCASSPVALPRLEALCVEVPLVLAEKEKTAVPEKRAEGGALSVGVAKALGEVDVELWGAEGVPAAVVDEVAVGVGHGVVVAAATVSEARGLALAAPLLSEGNAEGVLRCGELEGEALAAALGDGAAESLGASVLDAVAAKVPETRALPLAAAPAVREPEALAEAVDGPLAEPPAEGVKARAGVGEGGVVKEAAAREALLSALTLPAPPSLLLPEMEGVLQAMGVRQGAALPDAWKEGEALLGGLEEAAGDGLGALGDTLPRWLKDAVDVVLLHLLSERGAVPLTVLLPCPVVSVAQLVSVQVPVPKKEARSEALALPLEVPAALAVPHPVAEPAIELQALPLGDAVALPGGVRESPAAEGEARPLCDGGALTLVLGVAEGAPLAETESEALGVGVAGCVAAAVAEGAPVGEAPAGVGVKDAVGWALQLTSLLGLGATEGEGVALGAALPEAQAVGEALTLCEGERRGEPVGATEPLALPEAVLESLPRRVAVEPGLPVPLRVGAVEAVVQGEGGAENVVHAVEECVPPLVADTLPQGLGGGVAVPLSMPVSEAQPEGLRVPRGAVCEALVELLGRNEELPEAVAGGEPEALAGEVGEASATLREGVALTQTAALLLKEGVGAPLRECAPSLPLGLAETRAVGEPLNDAVAAGLALWLTLSRALIVRGAQRVAVGDKEREGCTLAVGVLPLPQGLGGALPHGEGLPVGEGARERDGAGEAERAEDTVAPAPSLREGSGEREVAALVDCAALPVPVPQVEPPPLGVPT
jgi:hypothetical protein